MRRKVILQVQLIISLYRINWLFYAYERTPMVNGWRHMETHKYASKLNKSNFGSQWVRRSLIIRFKNMKTIRRRKKITNHPFNVQVQHKDHIKYFVVNKAMKAAQLPMIISHCAIDFIND